MPVQDQNQSSFRDPAGFIVNHNGSIYRQVNNAGKTDYDQFMSSGLYASLQDKGMMLEHTEVKPPKGLSLTEAGYKLLRPRQLQFISYPYEWSFSQLKDAALLTLAIQQEALRHKMILKDASAYNIQFVDGRPVLIDTLSFEIYKGSSTWKAYKQFCQHFLGPLALMAHTDVRLSALLRDHIDGIPLDLVVKLLPKRKRLRAGLLIHLWMHAMAQQKFKADPSVSAKTGETRSTTTRAAAQADSLRRVVQTLRLPKKTETEWGEYYSFTNYEDASFKHKQKLVGSYIEKLPKGTVWDLGGNDGHFSRVALKAGAPEAICFDIDPIAVEKNYNAVRKSGEIAMLPLLLDLTNPSPAIGWGNAERSSLDQRANSSTIVMSLALIHHLAISNNLPLGLIAEYFSKLGSYLIIEFVPKNDSKVKILLATREDIFPEYTEAGLEAAFKPYFTIMQQDKIKGSNRRLYLMKRT